MPSTAAQPDAALSPTDHVQAISLGDLQVEMLEQGAITVRGTTAVGLTQETFQCFYRCLGDSVPPDLPDFLRTQLNGDRAPELDAGLLRAAGAPLPTGLYDVVDAAPTLTAIRHTGICVTCPSEYCVSYAHADAWGVEGREAGTPTSHRRVGVRPARVGRRARGHPRLSARFVSSDGPDFGRCGTAVCSSVPLGACRISKALNAGLSGPRSLK